MKDVDIPPSAIDVRLFSSLREEVGRASIAVDVKEPLFVDELLRRLAAEHPAIESFLSCIRVAVNQEYVGEAHLVRPGDEVALITPVSGG